MVVVLIFLAGSMNSVGFSLGFQNQRVVGVSEHGQSHSPSSGCQNISPGVVSFPPQAWNRPANIHSGLGRSYPSSTFPRFPSPTVSASAHRV